MSGIYVHIPYCKVKCHYCDFHFSTNTDGIQQMVDALCLELAQRRSYIIDQIDTIYFGGGTPSYLEIEGIHAIIKKIHDLYDVHHNAEVTLEANPDDLNKEKLQALYALGVTRLSIGIQSFDDEVLRRMNRAHSANEAINCVQEAQQIGFDNITTDLIYGIPDKGMNYWKDQLNQMVQLGVPHISSYCLTIEDNTVFGHLHKKGELKVPTDEMSLEQFKYMIAFLADHGFEHYEISNFAKEGFISKHNSSYWLGKKYLGIGPSAHSFDGDNRGWNISNNPVYIKMVNASSQYHEIEELTEKDKFNDYILTRLRTKWGIELSHISSFESEINLNEFQQELEKHLSLNHLSKLDQKIVLTDKGKFIADNIAADLFV